MDKTVRADCSHMKDEAGGAAAGKKRREGGRENMMGSMPVPLLIIKTSIPLIISLLVNNLYNLVDSIFVSRVNEESLTGISLAAPLQMVMISLGCGLAVGLNALVYAFPCHTGNGFCGESDFRSDSDIWLFWFSCHGNRRGGHRNRNRTVDGRASGNLFEYQAEQRDTYRIR